MQDTTVPSPGHDQVSRTGGKISEFFAGENFDYVKGEAAKPYNDEKKTVLNRYDRQIVYIKPHFFIIRDELAAPQPRSYNLLLHSDGMGEFASDGDGFRLTRTSSQVFARVQASAATTPHIGTYPGAENYGPFLRVQSVKTPSISYTTFLYPQPYRNPKLLQNGDFEKGMSGWTPRAGADTNNHTIVEANTAEGKQAARIEKSGYLYSAKFPQAAGAKVTARVRIRTEGAPVGKGATMHIYFWKGGKSFDQVAAGPFNSEEWTEQTISGIVPPGTEEVSLALEYFAPGAGYFDDVRIESNEKVEEGVTPIVKPLGNDGFDVSLGTERYIVLCGESGRSKQAGGLSTDAAIAVVGLNSNGMPISGFMQNGKSLTWNGQNVILLTQPATAEVRTKDDKLTAQIAPDVTPHAALPNNVSLTTSLKARQAFVNNGKANAQAGKMGTIFTRIP